MRGRPFTVSVVKEGRSGHVHVAVGGRTLQFYWEYGGGNCIARVAAPDPHEWSSSVTLAEYGRDEFLAGLAREIARLECPSATIEVARDGIYFYESSRPGIASNPGSPDGPPAQREP